MDYVYAALFGALGYLLGAIPFGVIIARSRGVDIFKFGSGNPGATNVKRACGKTAGNLCFFLDALKGFLAVYIPKMLVWGGVIQIANIDAVCIVAFVAAIIGHMFPAFTKFKGGKGVSVTIGGLIAFMWLAILIGLVVWVVAFYGMRFVSVASMLLAASLPFSTFLLYGHESLRFYLALFIFVAVLFTHRSNISRLIAGTEHKFVK
jgi:acyl-phosphate glycerol 3-phosphate acyltransferase